MYMQRERDEAEWRVNIFEISFRNQCQSESPNEALLLFRKSSDQPKTRYMIDVCELIWPFFSFPFFLLFSHFGFSVSLRFQTIFEFDRFPSLIRRLNFCPKLLSKLSNTMGVSIEIRSQPNNYTVFKSDMNRNVLHYHFNIKKISRLKSNFNYFFNSALELKLLNWINNKKYVTYLISIEVFVLKLSCSFFVWKNVWKSCHPTWRFTFSS